jgi:hypothetical protein
MKNPSRRRVAIALLAVMLSAATHSANAAPVDFARAELARIARGYVACDFGVGTR